MVPPTLETFLIGLLGVFAGAVMKFALDKTMKRQDRREDWYEELEHRVAVLERQPELQDINVRLKIIEYKVGVIFRGIEDHVVKIVLPDRPERER